MARGWESKSVEDQQAETIERRQKPRGRLSKEEATVARKRENLRMSREHIRQQLAAASNPRHRVGLEAALAELEKEIRQLTNPREA